MICDKLDSIVDKDVSVYQLRRISDLQFWQKAKRERSFSRRRSYVQPKREIISYLPYFLYIPFSVLPPSVERGYGLSCFFFLLQLRPLVLLFLCFFTSSKIVREKGLSEYHLLLLYPLSSLLSLLLYTDDYDWLHCMKKSVFLQIKLRCVMQKVLNNTN
jgi:hypothetical protein